MSSPVPGRRTVITEGDLPDKGAKPKVKKAAVKAKHTLDKYVDREGDGCGGIRIPDSDPREAPPEPLGDVVSAMVKLSLDREKREEARLEGKHGFWEVTPAEKLLHKMSRKTIGGNLIYNPEEDG